MSLVALVGIALSLSLDAFAASLSSSCSLTVIRKRIALKIAFSFGLFQGIMPFLGYYAGLVFRAYVQRFNHWLAFSLMALIGGRMIYEGIQEGMKGGCEDRTRIDMSTKRLLFLSFATSIDAFVIGVSFAILHYPILVPALIIMGVTFAVSLVGVTAGRVLKHAFSEYAEIAGGILLVLLGVKIFFSHV